MSLLNYLGESVLNKSQFVYRSLDIATDLSLHTTSNGSGHGKTANVSLKTIKGMRIEGLHLFVALNKG